jgi:hypothetical protein
MDIIHDDYRVTYDPASATILWAGALRLAGPDYEPISALMSTVAAAQPATITLDLRGLQFLNSFGINVLSRFVTRLAKEQVSQLVVLGSTEFTWQQKSLRLLPRLMREVRLVFGE